MKQQCSTLCQYITLIHVAEGNSSCEVQEKTAVIIVQASECMVAEVDGGTCQLVHCSI